jgi:hypothetical protein
MCLQESKIFGTAGNYKHGYKGCLKHLFQSGNKMKFEILFWVPVIITSNLACSYVFSFTSFISIFPSVGSKVWFMFTKRIKILAGQEKPDFWKAIGGQEEYARDKHLADSSNTTPARLFQCSNATGVFKGMS